MKTKAKPPGDVFDWNDWRQQDEAKRLGVPVLDIGHVECRCGLCRNASQPCEECNRRTKRANGETMKTQFLLDDHLQRVSSGDSIRFSYGTPPVQVVAKVVQRGNSLIVLTPGHNPSESNLRTLRRHVGPWFRC